MERFFYGVETRILRKRGLHIALEKLAEAHIRRVLDRVPVLIEAAGVLGIDHATLYRKRKEMGPN